jgi:hypothetical protein
MKGWVFFLAAIATASSSCPGVAGAQGYGVGTHSCAEFAKLYTSNPSVAEDIFFTWAQGFMSGLNASSWAETGTYRSIEGTPSEMVALKVHIRSYCDVHPLGQYVSAILDVYNSLPIKKENSN